MYDSSGERQVLSGASRKTSSPDCRKAGQRIVLGTWYRYLSLA